MRAPRAARDAHGPQSFLAADDQTSRRWRQELIRTLLERDLPVLGLRLPTETLRRFWQMLAHYPKVYIADAGLLHALLGLGSMAELTGHPKVGASWEGFAITAITAALGARRKECYFWALHTGAELDLLVARGQRRLGFEIKLTDSPRITPSMRSALEHLDLERLYLVHAGEHRFPLTERIEALPLRELAALSAL